MDEIERRASGGAHVFYERREFLSERPEAFSGCGDIGGFRDALYWCDESFGFFLGVSSGGCSFHRFQKCGGSFLGGGEVIGSQTFLDGQVGINEGGRELWGESVAMGGGRWNRGGEKADPEGDAEDGFNFCFHGVLLSRFVVC